MEDMNEKFEITICVGSSCYSRGNNKNLELLRKYLSDENLDGVINLKGCLCQEECKLGPNITINGEAFHKVEPNTVLDILNHIINKEQTI